jgi:hypothetical protein
MGTVVPAGSHHVRSTSGHARPGRPGSGFGRGGVAAKTGGADVVAVGCGAMTEPFAAVSIPGHDIAPADIDEDIEDAPATRPDWSTGSAWWTVSIDASDLTAGAAAMLADAAVAIGIRSPCMTSRPTARAAVIRTRGSHHRSW